jgi:Mg/Co/Ni transporter MgtE
MSQTKFSASADKVGYGADQYRQRSDDTNTLLRDLLGNYQGEGIAMSYTMADYRREKATEYFKNLTPEARRKALQSLTEEEQRETLRGLAPKERLAGLAPKERLAGLSPEEIANYLKELQSKRPARKGKPRRKK